MFDLERDIWLQYRPSLLDHNITVPGFSPLFPQLHCENTGEVCLVTTGEGQINAAATISALTLSDQVDLRKTYFLITGIAGVDPHQGTLGTAAFAKYAFQASQQYGLDIRDAPSDWEYGFWNYETKKPNQYPASFYGNELYALNFNLAHQALELFNASSTNLNDTTMSQGYRSQFDYAPANEPPKVILGDVATSDLYYAGERYTKMFFENAKVVSNNSATIVMSAQEDSATLESILRADVAGKADFKRVVILRTGSDFLAAPSTLDEYDAFETDQGGSAPAAENLYRAGQPFLHNVLKEWSSKWLMGVEPQQTFFGNVFRTDLSPKKSKRSRTVLSR